jgi:L-Ala-D/L-Glu epimerase
MTRRDVLGATIAFAAPAPGESSMLRIDKQRIHLKQTWTTTMSSSEYRDVIYVQLSRNGITGVGEGAPIVRYGESASVPAEQQRAAGKALESGDWRYYDKVQRRLSAAIPGNYAFKAALDIALMDWVGKKLGVPLYALFGADPADAPVTTYSIGIGAPDATRQKVREATEYPVLKIKVGLDSDEETIAAVRSVTDKPLRVDANEGWKSKEVAVEKIRWLETQGVEFVEQPMPAAMLEEVNWVRKRVNVPIIADEACLRPDDIPKLANHYDGVNIKLDKCGGLQEGWRMIQMARTLGLKTMLGCMISTSVSITAAAHLSPLADYADLDGNLLIRDDPYTGVKVVNGKLILPAKPGLGVERRA